MGHNPRGARPAVCVATPFFEPTRESQPPHNAPPASQLDMLVLLTKASGKWCRRFWTCASVADMTRRDTWPLSCTRVVWSEVRIQGRRSHINERNPAIAEHVEHAMTQEVHHAGCLAELHNACGRLRRFLVVTHLVRIAAWQTTKKCLE